MLQTAAFVYIPHTLHHTHTYVHRVLAIPVGLKQENSICNKLGNQNGVLLILWERLCVARAVASTCLNVGKCNLGDYIPWYAVHRHGKEL